MAHPVVKAPLALPVDLELKAAQALLDHLDLPDRKVFPADLVPTELVDRLVCLVDLERLVRLVFLD